MHFLVEMDKGEKGEVIKYLKVPQNLIITTVLVQRTHITPLLGGTEGVRQALC